MIAVMALHRYNSFSEQRAQLVGDRWLRRIKITCQLTDGLCFLRTIEPLQYAQPQGGTDGAQFPRKVLIYHVAHVALLFMLLRLLKNNKELQNILTLKYKRFIIYKDAVYSRVALCEPSSPELIMATQAYHIIGRARHEL